VTAEIASFFSELRAACGPAPEFDEMEQLCRQLRHDPSVHDYLNTFSVIAGSDRTLKEKVNALLASVPRRTDLGMGEYVSTTTSNTAQRRAAHGASDGGPAPLMAGICQAAISSETRIRKPYASAAGCAGAL
jgi:hypothetical protein